MVHMMLQNHSITLTLLALGFASCAVPTKRIESVRPSRFSTPTPTSIRIERTIDAPVDFVWRAHTEPTLVKRWLTGPEDHSLPVCEIDFRVGGRGRYVWKNPQFEMGMTSEFREIDPHHRIVHTEAYDGWVDGDATVTSSFAGDGERTKVTIEIEYKTPTARDAVFQPKFQEGYEASYQHLDRLATAR